MVAFFFTAQGYASLETNIENLRQKRNETRAELSKHTVQQLSSDSSGDGGSPEHLEAARDVRGVEQQLQSLRHIRSHAQIVPAPTDTERAQIGHVVTIQRYSDMEGEKPIGKPETYLIGGYQESDIKAIPPVLSYDSPILGGVMNRRVDPDRDPARVVAREKVIYVELLSIAMPPPESQLKLVKAS